MNVSIAIGVDSDSEFLKDEGRIVAVKPSGWQWGTEEVKQFLILELDLGASITTIEDAQKLTVHHFEDESLWWLGSSYEEVVGPIGQWKYDGQLKIALIPKQIANLESFLQFFGEREVLTDDGKGELTGDKGGKGTVDYSTGIYSLTFNDKAEPYLGADGNPLPIPKDVTVMCIPNQKILSKRRYSIPLTDLVAKTQTLGTTIDLTKVKDMTVKYQPVEKITIPFQDMVWDKVTSKKLDVTDLVKIKSVGRMENE